jgi:hypothetical protein
LECARSQGAAASALIPSLTADAARSGSTLVSPHPRDVPVRQVYAATPLGLGLSAATEAFRTLLKERDPRSGRAGSTVRPRESAVRPGGIRGPAGRDSQSG